MPRVLESVRDTEGSDRGVRDELHVGDTGGVYVRLTTDDVVAVTDDDRHSDGDLVRVGLSVRAPVLEHDWFAEGVVLVLVLRRDDMDSVVEPDCEVELVTRKLGELLSVTVRMDVSERTVVTDTDRLSD